MTEIKISGRKTYAGELSVPGDKSISHRAIIFGSLAEGESRVENFLSSEDCLNTAECFRLMGVSIINSVITNKVTIKGVGLNGLEQPHRMLDVGNAGTAIRLMLGVLAGQRWESCISGDASIQKRPMARVTEPLGLMGARFEGDRYEDKNGRLNLYPPITVVGKNPLHNIVYEMPMASAQVKSAVLLAGLFADPTHPTIVVEPGPARDHTERMLAGYGAEILVEGKRIFLKSGRPLKGQTIKVPGDISSAAFFIVAALICPGSDILIKDVGVNPTRTGIIEVLQQMGGNIQVLNQRLVCGEPVADLAVKHSLLHGVTVSGEIIPRLIDEIPILAVAMACAEGRSDVKDAGELRVKESDRIATITAQLKKFNVIISETPDGFWVIDSRKHLKPATATSHGDHRIAMSCAILGSFFDGETTVEDTDCINTSFPGFARLMEQISG